MSSFLIQLIFFFVVVVAQHEICATEWLIIYLICLPSCCCECNNAICSVFKRVSDYLRILWEHYNEFVYIVTMANSTLTLNFRSSDDVSSNDAIGAGPNRFCFRGVLFVLSSSILLLLRFFSFAIYSLISFWVLICVAAVLLAWFMEQYFIK